MSNLNGSTGRHWSPITAEMKAIPPVPPRHARTEHPPVTVGATRYSQRSWNLLVIGLVLAVVALVFAFIGQPWSSVLAIILALFGASVSIAAIRRIK